MAEDVSDEVIVEILLWLPVESIMRFKCVCRTWYALFQNPKFVARHLANQSKEHILLKRLRRKKVTVFNVIFDVNDVSSSVDLYWTPKKKPYSLIGHCDGIVALMGIHYDWNVMVCNPEIREFRTLPKSSAWTSAAGFGYDHRTNDYKVVNVVSFKKYEIPFSSRFEVFSLRSSDSSWRQVKNVVAEGLKFRLDNEDMLQYLDGAFYWWGSDYRTSEELLLSFDLADEVFRKSPMPYFCDIGCQGIVSNSKHIGVYNNESIAMFVYPDYDYTLQVEKCIDVWVLKEFGVKASWTKQLTISLLLEFYRPIVLWKNDEVVILHQDANRQLFCYDPVTLESKRLPLRGIWFRVAAVTYKKTLVSVHMREDVVV